MNMQILQDKEFLYRQSETEVEVVGYTGSQECVTIPDIINGKPVTALGFCDRDGRDSVCVKLNAYIRKIAPDALSYKYSTDYSFVEPEPHSWIHYVETDADQPYFCASDGILYSKDKSVLIMCTLEHKEEVSIPETVRTIKEYAFYSCHDVEEFTIPVTVSYIGDYAFAQADNVKISGNTELGNNVARKLDVSESNRYVVINGLLLSADQTRLLKVVKQMDPLVIPKGVTVIDDEALRYPYDEVKKIILPDGLKKIGRHAFSGALAKVIDIPATVEHMERNAFENVGNKISINLLPGNPYYRYDGKIIYHVEEDGSETVFCVKNKAATQLVISNKVKVLTAGTFDRCRQLKKLILNDGLEYFDEACLPWLSWREVQLERILIPATVKSIKLDGMSGVLGGKVKYTIHEDNPYFYMDDDICYQVDEQGRSSVLFCQNKMLGHAVINDNTIAINENAFSAWEEKSYNGTKMHGVLARLNKITLPDSLESIGPKAFCHCPVLTEIVLGPSVKEIHQSAFEGCKKLKRITVSPENECFADIDGVLFDKEIKNLIIYPEGRKVKQYELPASVEGFGTAFANVDCIQSLHLSQSLKNLAKYAFPKSCKIKSLYIQNQIADIDVYAFYAAGQESSEARTREEPIEVYVNADNSFIHYAQQIMKSPKGDICVCVEGDTPEMIQMKKQFAFEPVEDGLRITQYLEPSHGKKSSPTLVIPAMLGDQPVVEMGTAMFGGLSYGLNTIIISEGIKRIGDSVLDGHSNLSQIVFPASVEEISPWVFTDKRRKFKDLYIGSGTVIVVEPNSYAEKFVTEYKFDRSTPIIRVNDDSAKYLRMISEDDGFTAKLQECQEHTDRMIVPSTHHNKPVKKVVLYDGDPNQEFDYGKLPEAILALSIPENVEQIVGIHKFRPESKTEDHLPSISIAEGNQHYWSDGIALYTKDRKTLLQLIDYSVTEYAVCEETERIADTAFEWCMAIERVELSANTVSLGKKAFCLCKKLKDIIGIEHVQEMGTDAIYGTLHEQKASKEGE